MRALWKRYRDDRIAGADGDLRHVAAEQPRVELGRRPHGRGAADAVVGVLDEPDDGVHVLHELGDLEAREQRRDRLLAHRRVGVLEAAHL